MLKRIPLMSFGLGRKRSHERKVYYKKRAPFKKLKKKLGDFRDG